MKTSRTLKAAMSVAAGTLVAVLLSVLGATTASAHGYTNSPVSRAYHCKLGNVSNCGPIQWEPHSVEGPKGFPAAGPADGSICAGGNAGFSQLDDPRGGDWPTTSVSSGQNFTFAWHLTAAHSTTSFEYFITVDGYDPSQPITRANLEPAPFLTVPYSGQPPSDISHSGTLPSKSGQHVILAVWTIADTANAFYQCSDVNFG
ncbi:chitin-binding protein [Stackebrandtia endophytica]|uniref:Chitin-binding protein n=1 Tax=Stackebrandtia endophytica TaxID=1496996 RepID=A0A543ATE6_9ACTN|nr:lytic polysaccharide monooxygenase auxiliary activity family 9 protein [Stackebrandtia endophytica]TQL75785.1 chitin-binding protein [Stackebrandtia endophytica]